MSLPCNDLVENYIRKFTKGDKRETQRALGNFLPNKAFFEEELLRAGLPREFCYLPLMLQKIQQENEGRFYSAGVWNLPLLVAVKYGLTVDDEIDERCDLKKSTAAAIAYLLDIQNKEKKRKKNMKCRFSITKSSVLFRVC
jgi:membrane-bound lytic murein transglycosylase D